MPRNPAQTRDKSPDQRTFTACTKGLERMTGIEPAFSAWEADVLPLNYIRRGAQTSGQRSGIEPRRTASERGRFRRPGY